MDSLVQKLGKAVKQVARSRGSNWWYTPHMAAASRAIADRIPLVNFVIEVRDARVNLRSRLNIIFLWLMCFLQNNCLLKCPTETGLIVSGL